MWPRFRTLHQRELLGIPSADRCHLRLRQSERILPEVPRSQLVRGLESPEHEIDDCHEWRLQRHLSAVAVISG